VITFVCHCSQHDYADNGRKNTMEHIGVGLYDKGGKRVRLVYQGEEVRLCMHTMLLKRLVTVTGGIFPVPAAA
jgi:hypothetical protein